MSILGIAVLFATSAGPPANFSQLVDTVAVEYFSRAVASANDGEHQKSLAMLKALLVQRATVRVDYSGLPEDVKPGFRRGVEKGLGMWRTALGDEMPFTLTDKADAPITIRFVDSISGHAHGGMECKGEITSRRRIQWGPNVHYFEFSADISIVRFRQGKAWMSADEVAHVAAHELGHALGLGDISQSGWLMGPMTIGKPLGSVTSEETRAVAGFRSIVKTTIEQVSGLTSRKQGTSGAGPRTTALP